MRMLKIAGRVFLLLFVVLNIVAAFHAYRFTHFSDTNSKKTNASKLSPVAKLKTIVFGISNPRPVNGRLPTQNYRVLHLQSNKKISCWYMTQHNSRGTVILFHGYGGNKSSMLDKSDVFYAMGYNTLLVDFMGSGDSEGNQTTIGFKEAEQVKTCFDFITRMGENHIFLFGTSLGAVAILKAVKDHNIQPGGIMLECPFGTMYETTVARFRTMNIPPFPMAGLLVFWGGLENGFWGFGHNPIDYAKAVKCPTLLLYGEQDEKVSRAEIDNIYKNLDGSKQLKTYPLAGHENYLVQYRTEWIADVQAFTGGTNGK
ncbi:alpha/beta hydrolase [Segetibacter sp. 3557_3]|uniref:alpha/beta hydrolase n=1 Tax=Segetibacter sp. 3557_3 TaxID=2547429 RepID=UPI001058B5EE|nr:alpha/beta hydrolase [Segetibacter sp. 3557_3]TDH21639.1 alpha/beta hydrolase [Segetibacter sp. 3557_3]